MTKVRTCPACSDRVAVGDAFCEGCGRPLPEDVGAVPAGHPDSVPTAPQASMSGAAPPDGPAPDASRGGTRPDLVPGEGAPTAPQVSLNAVSDERPGLVPTEGAPTAPQVSLAAPLATRSDPPAPPAGPGLCVWCPGRVGDGYCEKCGLLQPTGRDHVEVRTHAAVGVSDRGLRHKRNEDAMAIRVIDADAPHAPGVVCAVVCDGVSSSPRSDEASRVSAETGVAVLAERVRGGADPREATGAAMTRAAEAVAGIADSAGSAPACTFVSAVVDPATGTVTVGWVGDSRAYWLSGGPSSSASALLTKDDSWSEAMVQMGTLSREEAMRSANAHALIAWMGADSGEIDAHISTVTPTGPGAVVLCSDGLWNYYPGAQDLTDAVPEAGARPRDAARAYVSLALRAGGKDNITVVVVPVPPGGSRAGHD
ncbi:MULTISPECIES: PP2C family protein-serine/threonine phosphatase [Nocardiopsis]|uniref:Serine/threonine protein phosphatase n=1 Tax=Nocardiopsis sinuspersici TaxID=501010 RepID=A0A1V3C7Y8_9ACTN|nr:MULTISPECIES: protein phosphatase 2C domain-containing protein [Nocardiopsis]OOC56510.1 serine/threonine protein phosphatase [Nocardiopsis sinuspersici]